MNAEQFDKLMAEHPERMRVQAELERAEREQRAAELRRIDAEERQRQREQREPASVAFAAQMVNKSLPNHGVSVALSVVADDRAGMDIASSGCVAGGLEMAAQAIADSLPAGVVRDQFAAAAKCNSSLGAERSARIIVGLAGLIVELRAELAATKADTIEAMLG